MPVLTLVAASEVWGLSTKSSKMCQRVMPVRTSCSRTDQLPWRAKMCSVSSARSKELAACYKKSSALRVQRGDGALCQGASRAGFRKSHGAGGLAKLQVHRSQAGSLLRARFLPCSYPLPPKGEECCCRAAPSRNLLQRAIQPEQ